MIFLSVSLEYTEKHEGDDSEKTNSNIRNRNSNERDGTFFDIVWEMKPRSTAEHVTTDWHWVMLLFDVFLNLTDIEKVPSSSLGSHTFLI